MIILDDQGRDGPRQSQTMHSKQTEMSREKFIHFHNQEIQQPYENELNTHHLVSNETNKQEA